MSSTTSSAPGTPSRSSRPTSPILTPRSKIKAFVASLDDSSDDDSTTKSPSKKTKSPHRKSPRPAPENDASDDVPLFFAQSDEDESEAEPSASPARPRGGLVGRMKPKLPAKEQIEKPQKSVFGNNSDREDANHDEAGKDAEADAEDEDDEMPVAPRRTRPVGTQDDSEDDTPVAPRRKRIEKTASSRGSSPANSTREGSTGPADGSDSEDLPANPLKGSRFLALVEKKRKEREAKEAEERKKQEERKERMLEMRKKHGDFSDADEEDDSENNGRTRTKRVPRRKASKKAMEEMHKETERMRRNMQLSIAPQVRKKITKQSLFEKFNFKPVTEEPATNTDPAPADSSSVHNTSDVDVAPQATPDSSPPPENPKKASSNEMEMELDFDGEVPSLEDLFASIKAKSDKAATEKAKAEEDKLRAEEEAEKLEEAQKLQEIAPNPTEGVPALWQTGSDDDMYEPPQPKLDKGKGKAIVEPPQEKPKKAVLPTVNLSARAVLINDDSDSDLEIVTPAAAAQRAAAEKQSLIQSLKQARKPVPPKKPTGKKKPLTAKELQAQLLQKSRLQAMLERQERIEELKAKGVIIQTAEERAQEQWEIENLVEKARLDALEIKRREKRAEMKKKGLLGAEEMGADEEDDDEEWLSEIPEDEDGWRLSGEEGEGEDEEGEDENGEEETNAMVDGQAAESAAEESADENDAGAEEAGQDIDATPDFSLSSLKSPRLSDMPSAYIEEDAEDSDEDGGFAPFKRKGRKKNCVTDEDDEDEKLASPVVKIPSIFQKQAAKPPAMGMSQLFAATLAENGSTPVAGLDKLDALRQGHGEGLENSQAPLNFESQSQDRVPETQSGKLDLHYSQSQIDQQESLPRADLGFSQSLVNEEEVAPSQMPDPTQDVGFTKSSSPMPDRWDASPSPPPGTIPTQVLEDQFTEPQRARRRLMRKNHDFSDEEREDSDADDEDGASDNENAFSIMKRASKKKSKPTRPEFDKSKSEAKGMVHEQAEESEDEYAGIGGASDEEDADVDHDRIMADILDDTTQVNVDERAMAAYYAEKERQDEEKGVTKLFRDLQSGLLRKKRGAEFDLDDSDDEYLALERKRRAKKRQIQQVRKMLMQDGNIEKIATDPKKAAFFKTLEDNENDDEMDFLDQGEEDLFIQLDESEDKSQGTTSQDRSQEGTADDDTSQGQNSNAENVPPPMGPPAIKNRRPVRMKKPSLAEVRSQLSFLTEDSQLPSSDDDASDTEQPLKHKPRCTTAVIDRIVLARTVSASVSTRMAFGADASAQGGFRVPTLARRATSQLSEVSTGSVSTTERSLVAAGMAGVRKGTGRANSSIVGHKKDTGTRVEAIGQRRRKERELQGKAQRGSIRGVLGARAGSFS